jgi:molecular chaperone DnaK
VARGAPQIEVTFDIDANGIVSVQAKDRASGKEQQIRIEAGGGLSESDIKKMVKEAKTNEGSDKKRRDFVELKNHGDATSDRLEKTLREHGQMLKAQDKTAAESAIAAARAAMGGSDHEKLKQATENLSQAAMRIEEAAQKARGVSAGSQASRDEDVMYAEFEEVGAERK